MPPKRKRVDEQRIQRVVADAAAKFKSLTFEDPVKLQLVGRSKGVMLNKKMYSRNTVEELLARGDRRVPHSRRVLTDDEVRALVPRRSTRRIDESLALDILRDIRNAERHPDLLARVAAAQARRPGVALAFRGRELTIQHGTFDVTLTDYRYWSHPSYRVTVGERTGSSSGDVVEISVAYVEPVGERRSGFYRVDRGFMTTSFANSVRQLFGVPERRFVDDENLYLIL